MSLYRGQTLVGLMISLSLSSFLLLAVIKFYTFNQQQNQTLLLHLKLQAELQRTIQLIGKDLRRSGFRASVDKLENSNFSLFAPQQSWAIGQKQNESTNSCILFLYDLNANGCVGETYTGGRCAYKGKNSAHKIEKELFGYRLNRQALETRLMYKSSINERCDQTGCAQYLQPSACDNGNWTSLLDQQEYEISQLEFIPIVDKRAIQVRLQGNLVGHKQIQYSSEILVPLLNQQGME